MALLRDPKAWTQDEIEAMLNAPPNVSLHQFHLMFEPQYQEVHYFADRNETVYAEPETFYLLKPSSPSDSTWMVPGPIDTRRKRYF